MTIRIAEGDEVFTFINTFHCAPANQAAIVASLRTFTTDVTSAMPGYVGVAVHASTDGTRVVNYVQWRSGAAMQAMREDPRARSLTWRRSRRLPNGSNQPCSLSRSWIASGERIGCRDRHRSSPLIPRAHARTTGRRRRFHPFDMTMMSPATPVGKTLTPSSSASSSMAATPRSAPTCASGSRRATSVSSVSGRAMRKPMICTGCWCLGTCISTTPPDFSFRSAITSRPGVGRRPQRMSTDWTSRKRSSTCRDRSALDA